MPWAPIGLPSPRSRAPFWQPGTTAFDVLLVGQEEVIRAETDAHPAVAQLPIEIVHASEVIGMEEKAAQAVKLEARLVDAGWTSPGA